MRKFCEDKIVAVVVAAAPAVAHTISLSNSSKDQLISLNSSPMAPSAISTATASLLRMTSCTMTLEILEENERLRKENEGESSGSKLNTEEKNLH